MTAPAAPLMSAIGTRTRDGSEYMIGLRKANRGPFITVVEYRDTTSEGGYMHFVVLYAYRSEEHAMKVARSLCDTTFDAPVLVD